MEGLVTSLQSLMSPERQAMGVGRIVLCVVFGLSAATDPVKKSGGSGEDS